MAKDYEYGTISVTKEFKRKLELLCRPGQRVSGVIEELYNKYYQDFSSRSSNTASVTKDNEDIKDVHDTELIKDSNKEPEIEVAIKDKQSEITEVPEVPEKQEVPVVPQNDALDDVVKVQPDNIVQPERQGELVIPESYMSLSEAQNKIQESWGKLVPVEYLVEWASQGVLKLSVIGNDNYIERASLEDMLNKYKLG